MGNNFVPLQPMIQEYPILMNGTSVWLDMPDDTPWEYIWDIDVYMASMELWEIAERFPVVRSLIGQFQCSLVVETNMEYYPFQEW